MIPAQEQIAPQVPHSIELEANVLGALLVDARINDDILFLKPDHFFDQVHGSIFAVIRDMINKHKAVSAASVGPHFANLQIDKDLTVPDYLYRLVDNVTSLRDVKSYAKQVRDLHTRRELLQVSEIVREQCLVNPVDLDVRDQIAEIEAQLFALIETGTNDRAGSMSDALESVCSKINEAYQNGGLVNGVSTGYPGIDQLCGGLRNSDLFILAARPSMGKTSLALNIAANVAQEGFVDFYSCEMSRDQLALRQLVAATGIEQQRLMSGNVSSYEAEFVMKKKQELKPLVARLNVDETAAISVDQIASRARRNKRKNDTKLIVVDYLQLMKSSGNSFQNKTQEVTEISNGLKNIAKELDVPVMALSQLNRSLESRENKRPQLSDLRESGSIEQDADVVAFVYRPEYYIEKQNLSPADENFAQWQALLEASRGHAEVLISKNRHGSCGTVNMTFDGPRMLFKGAQS